AAGSGGSAMSDCSPPADVFNPIATLSQTGCVDPNDPRKPIARAVSYEVNSPLWSDSADKQRAFVLPPGGKIHVRDCAANMAVDCPNGVEDDGRWNFPVGTVMIKIFMFDDKLVETRLFMLLDPDNWIGYSYEWDEGQTDAKITTSDRAEVMFNTGTRTVDWHYPSQQDCLTCHNPGAGFTLGPETAQLNRNVAGTMMNQIDQMAALGVFETAPAKPYKAALVTPYTSQAGNAGGTTTQQARSYLHANCGFCHRPGGAYSVFDLRNDTALKDTNICNVDIQKPPIPSAPNSTKILAPGSAMDSVMWQRMNVADPDVGRMPQIASYAVDTNATQVVGDWINSLKLADCTQ
ncbi:MAG TPA: hypothetical protein VGM44_21570, partial [Polyangiaceae bacterium]